MDSLIERFQKARQSKITAGSFEFTITRPSELDTFGQVYESQRDAVRWVSGFVIDWQGVKESDILAGEGDDLALFDLRLFQGWLEDRPELWAELITGVMKALETFREAQGAGKP